MADQGHERSDQETKDPKPGNAPDPSRSDDEEVSQKMPGYTPQARTGEAAGSGDDPSEELPSFTPQGEDY